MNSAYAGVLQWAVSVVVPTFMCVYKCVYTLPYCRSSILQPVDV